MGYIDVKAAMKDAEQVMADQEKLNARKSAVRGALRTAVQAGDTSPEQTEWIEQVFPVRERRSAEERAEDYAEKLATANAKLAEQQAA